MGRQATLPWAGSVLAREMSARTEANTSFLWHGDQHVDKILSNCQVKGVLAGHGGESRKSGLTTLSAMEDPSLLPHSPVGSARSNHCHINHLASHIINDPPNQQYAYATDRRGCQSRIPTHANASRIVTL